MKKNSFILLVVLGMIGYTIFSEDAPTSSSSQGTSSGSSSAQQTGYAKRSMEMAQSYLDTVPAHGSRIEALGAWGAAEGDEAVGLETDALRRNYYIIFDGSGSMGESHCADGSTKWAVARSALNAFIDGMPADANLGLFVFDQRGSTERVALGKGNAARVQQAVAGTSPSGSTPLGRSLVAAVQALSDQARRQRGYGEYHIVVITDGEASDPVAMDQMLDHILANTPITVHTVGFCIDGDHALNRPGRLVYRPAGNPDELRRGLEQVLAETEDFNAQSFE